MRLPELSPPARAWCHCEAPASGLLEPFRCRHCGHEMHLETLMQVPVRPTAVALRRVRLALTQPVGELLERP